MKNSRKLIIISIIIFILFTAATSFLYVLLHYLGDYSFKNVLKIITQIGLVGGIGTTVIFLLMNRVVRKVSSGLLRALLIILLILLFLLLFYQITWNIIFYQLDDPRSFISYLIEYL